MVVSLWKGFVFRRGIFGRGFAFDGLFPGALFSGKVSLLWNYFWRSILWEGSSLGGGVLSGGLFSCIFLSMLLCLIYIEWLFASAIRIVHGLVILDPLCVGLQLI